MTAKMKPRARLTVPRPHAPTSTLTSSELLQRIEAMGRRIDGYVKFMCQVGNLNATSAEANQRAIIAFHDQMVIVESQLSQIHDEFQLE